MTLEKYKSYAKHVNAQEDVIHWIGLALKSYLEKNPENQTEIEHIIDYMASDKRPKRISRMSYEQAKSNTEKWNNALIKKGCAIDENPEDVEVIKDFGDGFRVVKLIGENAYKREGFLMRHCVGSYYGKNAEVYSLRDKDNMPHCTMEKDQQIKGKGNGSIHPKYVGYIVSWLEEIGMTVGDSEMKNLGYINIEKIAGKVAKKKSKLYKGKYLHESATIYAKNGDEYCDLDLWDYKPLVVADGEFSLKINFDLSVFLPKAFAKIKKKKGNKISSGNYSTAASQGNYSKAASQGYSSTAASQGYYSTAASQGDSSKAASQGNYSKAASQGNYSKAEVNGEKSVAAAIGESCMAKASKGSLIVLIHYDNNNTPLKAISAIAGTGDIKADVFYKLDKHGNFEEVK